MRRSNMKRLPVQVVSLASLLCLLFVVYSGFQAPRLSAGDNLDALSGGQIFDRHWDPRLYNGAPGYDGFINWQYNATGVPAEVAGIFEHAVFSTEVQAAFGNWDAVDAFSGTPIVPIVSFAAAATATDAAALDGENAITWSFDPVSGALAFTPCWYLTADTTLEAAGLPIGGGDHIPFPGNVGDTQPKGALIDCGMEFNSAFAWSTAANAVAGRFDTQSVATHEAGHFVGQSHSAVGLSEGPNAMSASLIPFGIANDIEVRSLQQDDIASVLRTYARNASPPIAQTVGDQGVIELDLKKGPACDPATGVAVWAYLSSGGLTGATRVETFSGSQLRAGLPDEPFNGSVTLNVPPLSAGQSYTIYAQTFDSSNGGSATPFSAFRYNNTTINSNTLDPPDQHRGFDQLATVSALAAGATVDLGDIGILNCWVPVTGPAPDLRMDTVTAPAEGTIGGQISVTSDFSNQGSDAGAFEVGFYFSPDSNITVDDVSSGSTCSFVDLLNGAGSSCNGAVDVPPLAPGVYYVGAIADHLNQIGETDESNNSLASAPITISLDPLNPIVNGSFESGDFSGWTIKELVPASNPNFPLTVDGAGVEYPAPTFPTFFPPPAPPELDYFASAPTDGVYAALHDFNGDDPTTPGAGGPSTTNRRELYQDVTLHPGTTTLEFDYRAAWELFRFGSTMDRVFSVEIEPAGGGSILLSEVILLAVNGGFEQDTDIGPAPDPPYPSGYPDGIVDLSSLAGQNVRIKFVWNIPEPATGFAFFQLDNVRLNATANPVTENLATADFSTPRGTISSGSFSDTHTENNVYEVLTEEQQGGNPSKARSLLDHTWTFSVIAGDSYGFEVTAFRTDLEGEAFVFSYSLDNASFTDMVTIDKLADDDTPQVYQFQEDVAGTVYVRVQDTDRTRGTVQLDALSVDSMSIVTATGGGDVFPPAAPTGLTATGNDGSVSLDWADNGEGDLAGYRVHRSETSGGPYAEITLALAVDSDYVDNGVVNGTTYYYVVTAVDDSDNESAQSNEDSAMPQPVGQQTSVHVQSIVTSTVNAGQGNKHGRAVVVIVDNNGDAVAGATVTGTFTGDYNEPGVQDTTNASGSATITTAGTAKGKINFQFCVDSVSNVAPLTYELGDNVVTCASQ